MKKLLLLFIAMLVAATSYGLPSTKKYHATWTNTETDLAGYRLYWRTSTGSFSDTNRITVAKTATSQLLTGLVPENSIIAMTAFDEAGNESGFSNEVPFVGDGTAPSPPTGCKVVAVP